MGTSKSTSGPKGGSSARGVGETPAPPKNPKVQWQGYKDSRPSKGDLNQTFKG